MRPSNRASAHSASSLGVPRNQHASATGSRVPPRRRVALRHLRRPPDPSDHTWQGYAGPTAPIIESFKYSPNRWPVASSTTDPAGRSSRSGMPIYCAVRSPAGERWRCPPRREDRNLVEHVTHAHGCSFRSDPSDPLARRDRRGQPSSLRKLQHDGRRDRLLDRTELEDRPRRDGPCAITGESRDTVPAGVQELAMGGNCNRQTGHGSSIHERRCNAIDALERGRFKRLMAGAPFPASRAQHEQRETRSHETRRTHLAAYSAGSVPGPGRNELLLSNQRLIATSVQVRLARARAD